jgi:2-isopropylmalate synthase
VHCHNDLGLAVANSLAALNAGARQVECTINGLGERAGNAAMEEIVMAMRTRHDLLHLDSGIRTEKIMRASRLVSQITGFVVQPNKAIVGANAFAHEAGIHQDGVLKDAETYEIMTPESVGLKKSTLVMGKHSGRHAFREKLRELGYDNFGDNALLEAFTRFKDLADHKKEIFDEDIIAMVDDETGRASERIGFVSLGINCGSDGPQEATLTLEVDGETISATARGNGPVDATFNAIKEIFPHDAELQLYQVHAVTEGTDAQADVTVRLKEGGKMVNGQGAHIDTLVASARAYVHALNKLLIKRKKSTPDALTA